MKYLLQKLFLYSTIFILTLFNLEVMASPLFNEIMASNSSTIDDEDGDSSDWIEIINISDSSIDLKGLRISDDLNELDKWIFPAISLNPGKLKLIFASDKDRKTESPFLHTNFKINADGETLYISDSLGFIIDQVVITEMQSDLSLGRKPDGNSDWYYFTESTPGESNTTDGYLANDHEVCFSEIGGFYNHPLTVTISCDSPNVEIRYTTNGGTPTHQSRLYTEPIVIDKTRVLRAGAFITNSLPGKITTHTYILNKDVTLPVVSLSTNPEHLFGQTTGIYVNFWDDWERPVHFELFEKNGLRMVDMDGGISIGGGATRRRPQKTFRIYFRSRYGDADMDYQIFPELPVYSFTSLFLRNSGNDWDQTHFRDGLLQTLVDDLNIDTQDYRPAITYVNGMYWGILNIRERLTEEYLESHYGVDPDEVDLLEIAHPNTFVTTIEGSQDRFNVLYDYIINNNLSNSFHYDHVCTLMDMDNFLDYVIAEIYFNNGDWPTNNVKFWHPGTENGKFRWMLFDLDWSYGYQRSRISSADENTYKANSLNRALDSDGRHISFMIQKLMENNTFKTEFINRFADYLNTTFHPDHVLSLISDIQTLLEPEMPAHYDEFKNDPVSMWTYYVRIFENFAKNRPQYLRNHIQTHFNLSKSVQVNLETSPANSGTISVNHIQADKNIWQGEYFTDIPIILSANPQPGYRFTGWTGSMESDSKKLTITLTDSISLKANFEKDETANDIIVINEINYNSAKNFSPNDWFEIHNPTDESIDISNWLIMDEDDSLGFRIPENTVVNSDRYHVFCQDLEDFLNHFPEVENASGNLGFGLNNGGEAIKLINANGVLVDSVAYDDETPWPAPPDGEGPTLMLRNPGLDNALAESWTPSNQYGTPGLKNQFNITTSITAISQNQSFHLSQNYPNPFNPNTMINFTLPKSGFVSLKIYDTNGREIHTLIHEYKNAGFHTIQFLGEQYPSGIYFYTLSVDHEYSDIKKMLLIK